MAVAHSDNEPKDAVRIKKITKQSLSPKVGGS